MVGSETYFALPITYSTTLLISASDSVAPPLAGIAPLPLVTLLISASLPLARRDAQAALSSIFGAPAAPVLWQAPQTVL